MSTRLLGRIALFALAQQVALLADPSHGAAAAQPADESLGSGSAHGALDRAFRNLYDADFVQVLRITSRSPTGRELSQRLQITRKQTRRPGKALVRFLDPPDLRGTSLLVFQREDRDDDLFLYLPAFERTRRISSAQRSDAFFGTDFSYEDLEPKRALDYVVGMVGRTESDANPRLLIEARPRLAEASQYSRIVYAIDPSTDVLVWSEYFREGSLLKRMTVDPLTIRRIDGRHIPFRARMSSQRGTETLLEVESYELRGSIPEALFTVTNLEMGDPERDRNRSSDPASSRTPAAPGR